MTQSGSTRGAVRETGHSSRELAYRADIDGLRAVAVLLVVFNHAGLALTPGGFIGVDVFFVISGFLITGIITAQSARGAFRFSEFYLRRAKRLLPALYVLIIAVMIAGWWLLGPSDYSSLAQSALWSVGFASNIFFWRNTEGYFSPDASSFPLLHIWSLSLEEQFYLFWPAALLIVLKLRSNRLQIALLTLGALASFLYAAHGVSLQTKGSYFLLPARAGEFMIGALVWFLWRERRQQPLLANAISGLGLALILGSAALLTATSPFPGFTALAPCLGAALVIAAPQFGPSAVTSLLGTRPFVFLGLISYSVYLWHWPIVSFLQVSGISLTPRITVLVILGSIVLGAISWQLVERWCRAVLDRGGRGAMSFAIALFGAAVVLPVAIDLKQGVPERFPFALLTQDQLMAERNRYWVNLPARNSDLAAGAGKKLLIVGDSHAYDLAYALDENGYGGTIKLLETYHNCANFGGRPVQPKDEALCAERLRLVLASPDLREADAVYLHDHWGREDQTNLVEVIHRLRGITQAPIYVFGPKMTFTDDVLRISRQAQASGRVTVPAINLYAVGHEAPDRAALDRRLSAFFEARPMPGVRYVSVLEAQCGEARKCQILSPKGEYLYFDAGHLTLEGATRLGGRLRDLHPELF